MAKIFTTPGVYIQEIPKLPPSVAQVETSIPIFIGYTEKAIDGNNALPAEMIDGIAISQAKKISSLIDYELYFGGIAPQPLKQTVHNNPVIKRPVVLHPADVPVLQTH